MNPFGLVLVLMAGLLDAGSGTPLTTVAATGQDLGTVAEGIRRAWGRQQAAGVVGRTSRVVVQLPGTGGGAGMSRDQAVRLLEAVFRRSEEVETLLVSSREVDPGQGYVELLRRYRLSGTGEARSQRVLLAFRRGAEGGGWELVELRVVDGDG